MAPSFIPMASSPKQSPPSQVMFSPSLSSSLVLGAKFLCPCSSPCLRSPDNDSLFCVAPLTRSMECRSELYPICNACAPSSKSPQPCWSATTRPRSAIPSLVVDLGTLDDYANWRAWIRMDHKVALMDPSRYGRLDQVSGLLMLAKRTSSNHTNLVYPRL
eukprot:XP_008667314.1 uncharacterized protein LOC100216552 isoform X1 [Zea mays]